MNIHAQGPDFRLPCFLKSLCCHHAMNEQDVCFLETRATELANSGWTLARLRSQPLPSCVKSWSRPFQEFDLPIVTDSLKRFHRACTLFQNFPFRRCEPLVFDHHLHLKIRVRHDLNRREFSPVWEVAKRNLFQHVPLRRVRKSLSFNPKFSFTSQLRHQDQRRQKGQGFMNSLLIFSKFAPEGIQAPSPNRTTSNGENNES
jgi:hypothetical protein